MWNDLPIPKKYMQGGFNDTILIKGKANIIPEGSSSVGQPYLCVWNSVQESFLALTGGFFTPETAIPFGKDKILMKVTPEKWFAVPQGDDVNK